MMKHTRFFSLRVLPLLMSFCVVFSIVFFDVNKVSAMSLFNSTSYIEDPLYFNDCYSQADSSTTISVDSTSSFSKSFKWNLVNGQYYVASVTIVDNFTLKRGGYTSYTYDRYFVYDGEKYLVPVNNANYSNSTMFVFQYFGQGDFHFGGYYHMFFSARGLPGSSSYISGYTTPKIWISLYSLTQEEAKKIGNMDGVVNGLQSNKESIEKGNKLQEEANETSKGILGKITDFFGSFFENIINALKSLFIPEDGYFSDFFNRLNDLFSEKLGFLYAPIDLFVSFLNAIQNAAVGTSPGLVFPEIKWEDTVLVEETTVNFDLVNEKMPQLHEKIYFVTDIIMVGAVIVLLERKIDEVMYK